MLSDGWLPDPRKVREDRAQRVIQRTTLLAGWLPVPGPQHTQATALQHVARPFQKVENIVDRGNNSSANHVNVFPAGSRGEHFEHLPATMCSHCLSLEGAVFTSVP